MFRFRLILAAFCISILGHNCARYDAPPGFLALLLAGSSGSSGSTGCQETRAPQFSAWGKRRVLNIQNSGRAETLNDFPTLVVLNSTRIDYNQTQNSGQDLRFVDNDGVTTISHQIETWNEAGNSYVWVRIPQVEASTNADCIWMYYGNASAADGQNATNVWSSDFAGVFHLNSSVADSTSNIANGVVTGGVTDVAGKFSGGKAFAAGMVQTPINSPKTATSVTLSLWFRTNSTNSLRHFVWEGRNGENGWGNLNVATSHEMHLSQGYFSGPLLNCLNFFYGFESTGQVNALTAVGSFTDTTNWHYLTGVVRDAGTAPVGELYLDGALVASASGTTTDRSNWDTNFRMGADGTGAAGARAYTGDLDEVRVETTGRSSNWISAQFASQNDAGFIAFGNEQ
ncbi:MAG: DUF2341 domain-containing protein [Spirochaetia bacterium]|nr:DUF2341 domain-containing protein [Spirochaetia bacterium]